MDAKQLLSPRRFCEVLAAVRSANVRGSWSGSAFRSHPCGLLVGNMRLANHWHVNNYCDIVLGTTDKWRLGQNEPAAYGDPFPHCIDGEEVTVWCNGEWISEQYREALESRVVAILNRALADIAAAQSWKRVLEIQASESAAQKRAAVAKAALALATGA